MQSKTAIHNTDRMLSGHLTRRDLLKRAAVLGASVPAIAGLLAACEDVDDDDVVDDVPDDDDDEPAVDPDDDDDMVAETDDDSEEEPVDEPDEDDDEDPDVDPQEGGTVRYHYGVAPRTLNPLFSTSNREHDFQAAMFGGLVRINDGVEAVPYFAEQVEAAEDATEYSFTLYDDIRFTDGEQLTTEDVRFTFERILNPATASVRRGGLLGISGLDAYADGETDSVEGISTPDDLTVTFTLDTPDAVFLLGLAGTAAIGLLPKHILEDVAPEDMAEHDFSWEPTVSAGPFKFVQYATDQYIEFERNDDYFGDPPNVDRIFAVIAEPSVAIAQLETGELDIIPDLEYGELDRVEGMDHVTVHTTRSANLANVVVNHHREYLADKRVRQAMMYAIDHEGILDAALGAEYGEVTYHPFVAPDWAMEIEVPEYGYDPDRARELLEEAGWDSDQVIELWHREGWTEWWMTILNFLQDQWADVGIQVELVSGDTAVMNVITRETGDFDIMPFSGSTGDPGLVSEGLITANHPPDGGNISRYSNERVDELYELGKSTTDLDERIEIYTEMAQIINDEVAGLYLFRVDNVSAYANRVRGVSPPAYRDNTLWNAHEWYIEE